MTSDFWNKENFYKLKKALWRLYWDDFLVPACGESSYLNETSECFAKNIRREKY